MASAEAIFTNTTSNSSNINSNNIENNDSLATLDNNKNPKYKCLTNKSKNRKIQIHNQNK